MLGIELPLYKGKGIPPAFTIISQAVGFVVSNRVARLYTSKIQSVLYNKRRIFKIQKCMILMTRNCYSSQRC